MSAASPTGGTAFPVPRGAALPACSVVPCGRGPGMAYRRTGDRLRMPSCSRQSGRGTGCCSRAIDFTPKTWTRFRARSDTKFRDPPPSANEPAANPFPNPRTPDTPNIVKGAVASTQGSRRFPERSCTPASSEEPSFLTQERSLKNTSGRSPIPAASSVPEAIAELSRAFP